MPPAAASLAPDDHPNDSPAFPGFEPIPRVPVLLPLPLEGPYDYRVPAGLEVAPGSFVAVPLGRRTVPGVVWDADSATPGVAPERLKPIGGRLDVPPMTASMRRFIEWVAAYTVTPPGQVLRMAMSVASALEAPPPQIAYRLGETAALRPTPSRRRVFELLEDGRAMPAADLAQVASVSTAVLRSLVAAGALEPVALPESDRGRRPDPNHPGPALSPDQQAAAAGLVAAVEARRFSTTLLAGVTGAGKTEVYFEAIAAALSAGRRVLVLLPEIALSAQWLERFSARFGAPPAVWHSGLTPQRRRADWRRIARGAAPVVVGARSALFLPLADVGLVVVDEEHDASFKQEDGVIYHARDMAVVRARLAEAPVVLASATPSLETVVNAASGRYRRLDLPARHGGAAMPEVAAVDLRRDPPPRGRFISPSLASAVRATLADGEQSMLFLNRRGYAPLTLCRACGHRLQCPNCAAWLVEHRLLNHLLCHHCGHTAPSPRACPSCQAEGSLVACGPGVERLAEEATALFPEARLAIMASDLVVDAEAAGRLVAAMAAREIDILIGTQMMAKGHHFPHLTLVGVVDADLGLGGGDLRAGERTFQLLHQVAGRAGRAERPGRVLLQTVEPAHPVLRALIEGAGDAFLAAEADERRRHGMPPFGRLAALIVSSPEAEACDRIARALARGAPHGPGIAVLGPAPAPLSLLRGRHRRRLLLKTERQIAVQPLLRAWLARVPVQANVRVAVDVDPYTFL